MQCVCVCVCVCAMLGRKERLKETENENEMKGEKESFHCLGGRLVQVPRVCVCIFVCFFV